MHTDACKLKQDCGFGNRKMEFSSDSCYFLRWKLEENKKAIVRKKYEIVFKMRNRAPFLGRAECRIGGLFTLQSPALCLSGHIQPLSCRQSKVESQSANRNVS